MQPLRGNPVNRRTFAIIIVAAALIISSGITAYYVMRYLSPGLPNPPRQLTAHGENGYVLLNWSAPVNTEKYPVDGYKIYRGTAPGNETLIAEVQSSATSYRDSRVHYEETYYYYITAYNSAGESPKSNEVNATPHKPVILIHNVYELQNISNDLSGHYALANDINATITRTWNNGSGFIPIGDENTPFYGTFDGRGYNITGLFIKSSSKYVGLFGYVLRGAVIENVSVVDVCVSAIDWRLEAGGLVGENHGMVENSLVTGNVSASGWNSEAGGLMGENDGTVENSYATGNVNTSGSESEAGGLVGENWGKVSNSHALGNVSGYFAGGLVGENWGKVNNSHALGNVSGYFAGELVGENDGTVENSYATGNVRGYFAGGLVGENDGTVENSYATGNVRGYHAGGLFGTFNWYCGTLRNSHYDVDKVLINGGYYITRGGIFDSQFKDWLSNGKKLNITNYPSLAPDGEYYDINSVQGLKDLLGFAEDGLKFKLTADIDLSFTPDFYVPYFKGTFDGDNHTIANLKVNISFVSEVGLFGINKGTIEYVGVTNAYVNGSWTAGGLVGLNNRTVRDSHSSGNVSGYHAGGLVGGNCGPLSGSYSSGNVRGYLAGGLVGVNCDLLRDSYATDNVSGYHAGGLVGVNGATVVNSYATGNVSGYFAGGLVGGNYGLLSDSYATGNVSGSIAGGLVANNKGNITASFWDINSSGDTWSDGGIGKTTAEMKNKTTFTSAGWDFENIWAIKDGKTYPYLKWQAPSSAFTEKKLYAGCH